MRLTWKIIVACFSLQFAIINKTLSQEASIEYVRINSEDKEIIFKDNSGQELNRLIIANLDPYNSAKKSGYQEKINGTKSVADLSPAFHKDKYESRFSNENVSYTQNFRYISREKDFPVISFQYNLLDDQGEMIGSETSFLILDSLGNTIDSLFHVGINATRPKVSPNGRYLTFITLGFREHSISPFGDAFLFVYDLFLDSYILKYNIGNEYHSGSPLILNISYVLFSTIGNRERVFYRFDFSTKELYKAVATRQLVQGKKTVTEKKISWSKFELDLFDDFHKVEMP